MDLTAIITTMLGLSVLVERLLEAAFSFVERQSPRLVGDPTSQNEQMRRQAERYGNTKRVISNLAGIVVGAIMGLALGIKVFTQLGLSDLNATADALLTGAIAGALAPYSHQIIEGFFDLRDVLKGVAENKRQDALKKASEQ